MEFQYNENEFMTLPEFYENYQERLPILVYVVEGNYGKTIFDEVSTGEVLCVHTSVSQRRVLAQINDGNKKKSKYLSLPLNSPYRLVQEDHDVSEVCSLQQIVEENTLPISVKFAPDVGTFRVGQTVGDTRMFNRLKLLKEYNETFLCCNNVEESGRIRQEVSQLALSKDITVVIVTGISNMPAETFHEFLSTIGQNIAETDVTVHIGNPHIATVTTEGTGSGNPLSQSMLNLFEGKDNPVSVNTLYDAFDSPNDKKRNETDLQNYGNVESQQHQILETVENNVTEYSRVIRRPNTSGNRNSDCEIYDDAITLLSDIENTCFLDPINEIDERYSDECSVNQLEQIESSESSVSSSNEAVTNLSLSSSSKRMEHKQDLMFANDNLSGQSLELHDNTTSSQQAKRLGECASGLYEIPSEITTNFISGANEDTVKCNSSETPLCNQALSNPAGQRIEKNSLFDSGLYEDLDLDENLESTFILPSDHQQIPNTQLSVQTETIETIQPSTALSTGQETSPMPPPVRKPKPDTTNPDKLPKRRKPTLFAYCVQGTEKRELVMSGFYEIPVNNMSDNLLGNGNQKEQSSQRESETYATVSEVITDPQKTTTVTQPMSPPVKENKVRKNMFQVLEELVITVKSKKQEGCSEDTNKSSKADKSRSIETTKGDNPKQLSKTDTKIKVVKSTSVKKRFKSFLRKRQNKENPPCSQTPTSDNIGNMTEESFYMEMDFINKTQNSVDITTELSTTESQSTYLEMKPSISTAKLQEYDTNKEVDTREVKTPLSPFELSMYMCMSDIRQNIEKISDNDKTQPIKKDASQTLFEPCAYMEMSVCNRHPQDTASGGKTSEPCTYMEMSAVHRRPQDTASGANGAEICVYEDMNEVMKRK